MRVAVIGGTGLAGRQTVNALRRDGHDAVIVARSHGVDVSSGAGLDDALAKVDAVVDASNIVAADTDATRERFAAATWNLLAAERRANVRHHVLLSIVGVDRVAGNAHFAGKRMQEEILASAAVPVTIQRATQFFEFAATVVEWTKRGDIALVPPLLVQPVAAADVGEVLAEIATGEPKGRAIDLAGPEPQDFVDMARRTLAARGESVRLVPSWRSGLFGIDFAGEVLLPDSNARIAPTLFDTWLAVQRANAGRPATERAASR